MAKLIRCGRDNDGLQTLTPEYISANIDYIQSLPFDGTEIYIVSPTGVDLSNGHTWWSSGAIQEADYADPLATLAATPFTTLTDNLVYMGTGHGGDTFSWTNDTYWPTVTGNVAIFGKIA
jgi:hypothetical protein